MLIVERDRTFEWLSKNKFKLTYLTLFQDAKTDSMIEIEK